MERVLLKLRYDDGEEYRLAIVGLVLLQVPLLWGYLTSSLFFLYLLYIQTLLLLCVAGYFLLLWADSLISLTLVLPALLLLLAPILLFDLWTSISLLFLLYLLAISARHLRRLSQSCHKQSLARTARLTALPPHLTPAEAWQVFETTEAGRRLRHAGGPAASVLYRHVAGTTPSLVIEAVCRWDVGDRYLYLAEVQSEEQLQNNTYGPTVFDELDETVSAVELIVNVKGEAVLRDAESKVLLLKSNDVAFVSCVQRDIIDFLLMRNPIRTVRFGPRLVSLHMTEHVPELNRLERYMHREQQRSLLRRAGNELTD